VAPQSAPQALYALITGVISLLFSWLPMAGFIGVVPFVLGVYALYKINASDGRYGGAGQAVAGLLLGLASMVIALLVVLGVVIWLKAAEPI
jgi:uncharacterized iron-regulated membrane protein